MNAGGERRSGLPKSALLRYVHFTEMINYIDNPTNPRENTLPNDDPEPPSQEDWRKIAEQASHEHDADKLRQLVSEVCDLLEKERSQRRKG